MPHFASIAAPLTDPTKNKYSNHGHWTPECVTAFTKLKVLIMNESEFCKALTWLRSGVRFLFQVHASDLDLGAVLLQGEGEDQKLVIFLKNCSQGKLDTLLLKTSSLP